MYKNRDSKLMAGFNRLESLHFPELFTVLLTLANKIAQNERKCHSHKEY